jgi:hypothetical protein
MLDMLFLYFSTDQEQLQITTGQYWPEWLSSANSTSSLYVFSPI